MKKLFALLLCAAMLFCFSACASNEDVRGKTQSTPADTASDNSEETFSFGQTSGTKWENEFIGIGCELDSEWTFYTDEQIKELNNMTADLAGEDISEIIEDSDIIYDMYAIHSDGVSTMNVNLENTGTLANAMVDVKARLENTVSVVKDSFANMGIENINIEITTVTVDGKEYDAMNITGTYSGVNMYQKGFYIAKGKYLVAVTVSTFGEDTTQQLIDKFYNLD